MKYLIFLILLRVSYSQACDLQFPMRHLNPDQSVGGLIDIRAKVSSSAYIGLNAIVCGNSVVEKDVKMLDFSRVEDNSWIKPFVVLKDNVIISDESIIGGQERLLTIVEGNSKVKGRTKVLDGSNVKDSEISGVATVINSHLEGYSTVCGSSKIIDRFVISEDYCTSHESTASVFLRNLDIDSTNPLRDFKLFISQGEFHPDKEFHTLILNGNELEENEFEIIGNQVRIFSLNRLVSGLNTLEYRGYDSDLLKLKVTDFEFLAGENEKRIGISNSAKTLSIEAFLKIGGKKFTVKTYVLNETIILKNLPDLPNSEIELLAYNSDGLFFGNFTLAEAPEVLQLSIFPQKNNYNLDLSHGTEGWDISSPNSVQIQNHDEKNYFNVISGSERVIIQKTFVTNNNTEAVGVSLSLLSSDIKNATQANILKIFYYSKKNKKLQKLSLTEENIEGMFLNKASKPVNVSFENFPNDEVTLVFHVDSSMTKNTGGLLIGPPSELQYSIAFEPYDFSVYNVSSNPFVDTLSNYNCDNPSLNIPANNSASYKPFMIPLMYLSAGPNTMMNRYENRIHGHLKISPNLSKNIKEINLLVYQLNNGDFNFPKFKVPLHGCAYRGLRIDENGAHIFSPIYNLGAYLFSIKRQELEMIEPSLFFPVSLVVEVITTNGVSYKSQDFKPLNVLGVPNLPIRYTHKTPDNYNSNGQFFTRTGGEKFLHPRFLYLFTNLVHRMNGGPTTEEPFWKVNDLSKINGGPFKPHSGHIDGEDADMAFSDSNINLNFENWGVNLNKWEDGLSIIETMLENSSEYFPNIETVYITADEDISPQGNMYVVNKFHNRCIQGNRYIDIFEPKNKDFEVWEGTILRNITGHRDHIHVRFNNERVRPQRPDYYPVELPNFDESKINVEIKNNKIVANYSPAEDDETLTFFWRAQKDTYFYPNKRTLFSNRPNMNDVPADWNTFYVFFTLGKKGSGGCRQYMAYLTRDNQKSDEFKISYMKLVR